jgi:hypothetical protein
MRLSLTYSLEIKQSVRELLELPLKFAFSGFVLDVVEGDEATQLCLTIEVPIDRAGLFLLPADGEHLLVPHLAVPEVPTARELATGFVNALSFLTDFAIQSRLHTEKSRVVPDDQEDLQWLVTLGEPPVEDGTKYTLHPLIRAIDLNAFSPPKVGKLLQKSEGLQLYADALRLDAPTAQFRE